MLSFVVKNGQDRIVACGMNCDAFNVPVLHPKAARLGYVFEVLEHVKGPFRYILKTKKKVVLFYAAPFNAPGMRTTEIAARAWGFLDKSQKGV